MMNRNNTRVSLLWQKYKKLCESIRRSIKDGSFLLFTLKRRNAILKRLNRYRSQLIRILSLNEGASFRLPFKKMEGAMSATLTLITGISLTNPSKGNAQNFILETAPSSIFQMDVFAPSSPNYPEFADIDKDGDLDMFVGVPSSTYFYRNTSTNSSTAFMDFGHSASFCGPVFTGPNLCFGLGYVNDAVPAIVDIDGDMDLDIFLGSSIGSTYFFRNTSTNSTFPAFTLENSSSIPAFGLTNVVGPSAPTFVDIDGDGDLDAFIGSGGGSTYFFRNTSTNSSVPAFALENSSSIPAFGIDPVSSHSVPDFVDIDGDMDLDVFIGSQDGRTSFFRNTSTNSSIPAFVLESSDSPFGISSVGMRSAPTFVDIDGDGDFDAVLGKNTRGLTFFKNTAIDPEIAVEGLTMNIVNGSMSPSTSNNTDFGSAALGGTPITKVFTIVNSGNGTLFLGTNAVTISGVSMADFMVMTQPSATVAPGGGTTTFEIKFDPSALGSRVARINIANNDSDESPFTFDIVGEGIELPPENIPTIGQWGIFILGLLLSIFGLQSIRKNNTVLKELPEKIK